MTATLSPPMMCDLTTKMALETEVHRASGNLAMGHVCWEVGSVLVTADWMS